MGYHPGLGQFVQRDPKGYADGANLYQAYRSSPTNLVDPMGLSSLAAKISEIYFGRMMPGLVVRAMYNHLRDTPTYELFDVEGEMNGTGYYTQMVEFYKYLAIREYGSLKSDSWTTIYTKGIENAKASVSKNFDTGGGAPLTLKGWLGGAHSVFAFGKLEAKKVCRSQGEGKLDTYDVMIRRVDFQWNTFDQIDAKGLPEESTSSSGVGRYVEAIVGDWIGDRLLDVEFNVLIHWEHHQTVYMRAGQMDWMGNQIGT